MESEDLLDIFGSSEPVIQTSGSTEGHEISSPSLDELLVASVPSKQSGQPDGSIGGDLSDLLSLDVSSNVAASKATTLSEPLFDLDLFSQNAGNELNGNKMNSKLPSVGVAAEGSLSANLLESFELVDSSSIKSSDIDLLGGNIADGSSAQTQDIYTTLPSLSCELKQGDGSESGSLLGNLSLLQAENRNCASFQQDLTSASTTGMQQSRSNVIDDVAVQFDAFESKTGTNPVEQQNKASVPGNQEILDIFASPSDLIDTPPIMTDASGISEDTAMSTLMPDCKDQTVTSSGHSVQEGMDIFDSTTADLMIPSTGNVATAGTEDFFGLSQQPSYSQAEPNLTQFNADSGSMDILDSTTADLMIPSTGNVATAETEDFFGLSQQPSYSQAEPNMTQFNADLGNFSILTDLSASSENDGAISALKVQETEELTEKSNSQEVRFDDLLAESPKLGLEHSTPKPVTASELASSQLDGKLLHFLGETNNSGNGGRLSEIEHPHEEPALEGNTPKQQELLSEVVAPGVRSSSPIITDAADLIENVFPDANLLVAESEIAHSSTTRNNQEPIASSSQSMENNNQSSLLMSDSISQDERSFSQSETTSLSDDGQNMCQNSSPILDLIPTAERDQTQGENVDVAKLPSEPASVLKIEAINFGNDPASTANAKENVDEAQENTNLFLDEISMFASEEKTDSIQSDVLDTAPSAVNTIDDPFSFTSGNSISANQSEALPKKETNLNESREMLPMDQSSSKEDHPGTTFAEFSNAELESVEANSAIIRDYATGVEEDDVSQKINEGAETGNVLVARLEDRVDETEIATDNELLSTSFDAFEGTNEQQVQTGVDINPLFQQNLLDNSDANVTVPHSSTLLEVDFLTGLKPTDVTLEQRDCDTVKPTMKPYQPDMHALSIVPTAGSTSQESEVGAKFSSESEESISSKLAGKSLIDQEIHNCDPVNASSTSEKLSLLGNEWGLEVQEDKELDDTGNSGILLMDKLTFGHEEVTDIKEGSEMKIKLDMGTEPGSDFGLNDGVPANLETKHGLLDFEQDPTLVGVESSTDCSGNLSKVIDPVITLNSLQQTSSGTSVIGNDVLVTTNEVVSKQDDSDHTILLAIDSGMKEKNNPVLSVEQSSSEKKDATNGSSDMSNLELFGASLGSQGTSLSASDDIHYDTGDLILPQGQSVDETISLESCDIHSLETGNVPEQRNFDNVAANAVQCFTEQDVDKVIETDDTEDCNIDADINLFDEVKQPASSSTFQTEISSKENTILGFTDNTTEFDTDELFSATCAHKSVMGIAVNGQVDDIEDQEYGIITDSEVYLAREADISDTLGLSSSELLKQEKAETMGDLPSSKDLVTTDSDSLEIPTTEQNLMNDAGFQYQGTKSAESTEEVELSRHVGFEELDSSHSRQSHPSESSEYDRSDSSLQDSLDGNIDMNNNINAVAADVAAWSFIAGFVDYIIEEAVLVVQSERESSTQLSFDANVSTTSHTAPLESDLNSKAIDEVIVTDDIPNQNLLGDLDENLLEDAELTGNASTQKADENEGSKDAEKSVKACEVTMDFVAILATELIHNSTGSDTFVQMDESSVENDIGDSIDTDLQLLDDERKDTVHSSADAPRKQNDSFSFEELAGAEFNDEISEVTPSEATRQDVMVAQSEQGKDWDQESTDPFNQPNMLETSVRVLDSSKHESKGVSQDLASIPPQIPSRKNKKNQATKYQTETTLCDASTVSSHFPNVEETSKRILSEREDSVDVISKPDLSAGFATGEMDIMNESCTTVSNENVSLTVGPFSSDTSGKRFDEISQSNNDSSSNGTLSGSDGLVNTSELVNNLYRLDADRDEKQKADVVSSSDVTVLESDTPVEQTTVHSGVHDILTAENDEMASMGDILQLSDSKEVESLAASEMDSSKAEFQCDMTNEQAVSTNLIDAGTVFSDVYQVQNKTEGISLPSQPSNIPFDASNDLPRVNQGVSSDAVSSLLDTVQDLDQAEGSELPQINVPIALDSLTGLNLNMNDGASELSSPLDFNFPDCQSQDVKIVDSADFLGMTVNVETEDSTDNVTSSLDLIPQGEQFEKVVQTLPQSNSQVDATERSLGLNESEKTPESGGSSKMDMDGQTQEIIPGMDTKERSSATDQPSDSSILGQATGAAQGVPVNEIEGTSMGSAFTGDLLPAEDIVTDNQNNNSDSKSIVTSNIHHSLMQESDGVDLNSCISNEESKVDMGSFLTDSNCSEVLVRTTSNAAMTYCEQSAEVGEKDESNLFHQSPETLEVSGDVNAATGYEELTIMGKEHFEIDNSSESSKCDVNKNAEKLQEIGYAETKGSVGECKVIEEASNQFSHSATPAMEFDDDELYPAESNFDAQKSSIAGVAIKKAAKQHTNSYTASSGYMSGTSFSSNVPSSVFIDKDLLSDNEDDDAHHGNLTSSSEDEKDDSIDDSVFAEKENYNAEYLPPETFTVRTFPVVTSPYDQSSTDGSNYTTYQAYDIDWEDLIMQAPPRFPNLPVIMEETEPSDTEEPPSPDSKTVTTYEFSTDAEPSDTEEPPSPDSNAVAMNDFSTDAKGEIDFSNCPQEPTTSSSLNEPDDETEEFADQEVGSHNSVPSIVVTNYETALEIDNSSDIERDSIDGDHTEEMPLSTEQNHVESPAFSEDLTLDSGGNVIESISTETATSVIEAGESDSDHSIFSDEDEEHTYLVAAGESEKNPLELDLIPEEPSRKEIAIDDVETIASKALADGSVEVKAEVHFNASDPPTHDQVGAAFQTIPDTMLPVQLLDLSTKSIADADGVNDVDSPDLSTESAPAMLNEAISHEKLDLELEENVINKVERRDGVDLIDGLADYQEKSPCPEESIIGRDFGTASSFVEEAPNALSDYVHDEESHSSDALMVTAAVKLSHIENEKEASADIISLIASESSPQSDTKEHPSDVLSAEGSEVAVPPLAPARRKKKALKVEKSSVLTPTADENVDASSEPSDNQLEISLSAPEVPETLVSQSQKSIDEVSESDENLPIYAQIDPILSTALVKPTEKFLIAAETDQDLILEKEPSNSLPLSSTASIEPTELPMSTGMSTSNDSQLLDLLDSQDTHPTPTTFAKEEQQEFSLSTETVLDIDSAMNAHQMDSLKQNVGSKQLTGEELPDFVVRTINAFEELADSLVEKPSPQPCTSVESVQTSIPSMNYVQDSPDEPTGTNDSDGADAKQDAAQETNFSGSMAPIDELTDANVEYLQPEVPILQQDSDIITSTEKDTSDILSGDFHFNESESAPSSTAGNELTTTGDMKMNTAVEREESPLTSLSLQENNVDAPPPTPARRKKKALKVEKSGDLVNENKKGSKELFGEQEQMQTELPISETQETSPSSVDKSAELTMHSECAPNLVQDAQLDIPPFKEFPTAAGPTTDEMLAFDTQSPEFSEHPPEILHLETKPDDKPSVDQDSELFNQSDTDLTQPALAGLFEKSTKEPLSLTEAEMPIVTLLSMQQVNPMEQSVEINGTMAAEVIRSDLTVTPGSDLSMESLDVSSQLLTGSLVEEPCNSSSPIPAVNIVQMEEFGQSAEVVDHKEPAEASSDVGKTSTLVAQLDPVGQTTRSSYSDKELPTLTDPAPVQIPVQTFSTSSVDPLNQSVELENEREKYKEILSPDIEMKAASHLQDFVIEQTQTLQQKTSVDPEKESVDSPTSAETNLILVSDLGTTESLAALVPSTEARDVKEVGNELSRPMSQDLSDDSVVDHENFGDLVKMVTPQKPEDRINHAYESSFEVTSSKSTHVDTMFGNLPENDEKPLISTSQSLDVNKNDTDSSKPGELGMDSTAEQKHSANQKLDSQLQSESNVPLIQITGPSVSQREAEPELLVAGLVTSTESNQGSLISMNLEDFDTMQSVSGSSDLVLEHAEIDIDTNVIKEMEDNDGETDSVLSDDVSSVDSQLDSTDEDTISERLQKTYQIMAQEVVTHLIDEVLKLEENQRLMKEHSQISIICEELVSEILSQVSSDLRQRDTMIQSEEVSDGSQLNLPLEHSSTQSLENVPISSTRSPGDGSEGMSDALEPPTISNQDNGEIEGSTKATSFLIPLKDEIDSSVPVAGRRNKRNRLDTTGSMDGIYLTDSEDEDESSKTVTQSKRPETLISLDDDVIVDEETPSSMKSPETEFALLDDTHPHHRKSLVPPSSLVLSVALDDIDLTEKDTPISSVAETPASAKLSFTSSLTGSQTSLASSNEETIGSKISKLPRLPSLRARKPSEPKEPTIIQTRVELVSPENIIPIVPKPESRGFVKWETVTIKNLQYRIDEPAIQPYKKAVSHGGFYGDKSAIIEIFTSYLPQSNIDHYAWVMDNLFLYVLATIELLAMDKYSVVMFVGSTPKSQIPANSLLKKWHEHIDYRLKKNVETFYIVNPSFYFRTMARLFISRKVAKKLKYVKNMTELKKFIPTDFLFVPPEIAK